jgi:hypothetical protein
MTVDLIQRTCVDELRSNSGHVRGDPSVLDTGRELSLRELIYPIVVAYLMMIIVDDDEDDDDDDNDDDDHSG